MSLKVWARDPNRVRKGILPVLACNLKEVENGMDSWSMTLNGDDEISAALTDGWGVVVYEDDKIRFSGMIETFKTVQKGRTLTVDITGLTDKKVLRNATVYPDPNRGFDQQTTFAYYNRSGIAEDLIADVININVGPGSPFGVRRSPGLRTVVSQHRGATTTINARFGVLLEEVAPIANLNGLVINVRQVPQSTDREVIMTTPVDRSRAVRFTPNAGLGDFTMERTAPKATTVIVGGQGEGTARKFSGGSAPAEERWNERVEVFQDRRDTADNTEIAKQVKETLAENKAVNTVTFELTEAEDRVYGVDFNLGDIVSVEPSKQLKIVDKVRTAETTWTEYGNGLARTVKLSVGEQNTESTTVSPVVYNVKKMQKQIRNLEARK